MPRVRFISVSGVEMRLSDLARLHGLRPQTLWGRLERGLPVERAHSTGFCSISAAGRRGKAASSWAIRAKTT